MGRRRAARLAPVSEAPLREGPVAQGRVPSSPGDGRLRASPTPRRPGASAAWAGAAPPRGTSEARASRGERGPDPGMLLSGSAFRGDRRAAPASSGAGGASRRRNTDSSRDSGCPATTRRRAASATSAGMGGPASHPVLARASLTVAPSQPMPPPGRATTSDARTPTRGPSRGVALSRKDTPPPSARTRPGSCRSSGAGVTTAASLGAAAFGRARNRWGPDGPPLPPGRPGSWRIRESDALLPSGVACGSLASRSLACSAVTSARPATPMPSTSVRRRQTHAPSMSSVDPSRPSAPLVARSAPTWDAHRPGSRSRSAFPGTTAPPRSRATPSWPCPEDITALRQPGRSPPDGGAPVDPGHTRPTRGSQGGTSAPADGRGRLPRWETARTAVRERPCSRRPAARASTRSRQAPGAMPPAPSAWETRGPATTSGPTRSRQWPPSAPWRRPSARARA